MRCFFGWTCWGGKIDANNKLSWCSLLSVSTSLGVTFWDSVQTCLHQYIYVCMSGWVTLILQCKWNSTIWEKDFLADLNNLLELDPFRTHLCPNKLTIKPAAPLNHKRTNHHMKARQLYFHFFFHFFQEIPYLCSNFFCLFFGVLFCS